MTLTVRLDPALESALERYCAEHGVTKSLAVQQSLATYLINQPKPARKRASSSAPAPGPVYRAFERVGFIGAGRLGGVSATNDVVRAKFLERKRPRSTSR
jgi:hypothetical protein